MDAQQQVALDALYRRLERKRADIFNAIAILLGYEPSSLDEIDKQSVTDEVENAIEGWTEANLNSAVKADDALKRILQEYTEIEDQILDIRDADL